MTKLFTCASCGQTFEQSWSDEEAQTEYEKNFPDFVDEPKVVVCDDCYQRGMQSMNEKPIFNATWIIKAPWAHPVWQNYVMFLVDLTTNPPGSPEPTLHLPGATHEMTLWAVDPRKNDLLGNYEGKVLASPDMGARLSSALLQPPNYGYQWKANSDKHAQDRCQGLYDSICAKNISPDTDFRSLWDGMFEWFPLVRSGI